MRQELPIRILEEYLKTIKENTFWKKVGDEYVISLPFILASGHFLEISVREINKNFILISDKQNALSDLWLSGMKVLAQKRKIVDDILSTYNLKIEDKEITALAKITDIGEVFGRIIQALLRVGDVRLLHRITLVKEEHIVKRIRKVIIDIRPKYLTGPKAALTGKVESIHKVDFLSSNGHRIAVKGVDARKMLSLQEKVEAWAFKFGDIRTANPKINRVGIFDKDNENWTNEMLKITRLNTEKVIPIQEEDEIREVLSSGVPTP